MSPAAKSQDQINGPRPSPLKINKASHPIHKSSSSSLPEQQQQRRKHPVIIYTHSPKIIHTQARDFMALVQRLTGFSHSGDNKQTTKPQQTYKKTNYISNDFVKSEPSSSASQITSESSAAVSFLTDFPLFTPNNSSSNDFFCSPRTNGNSMPSPSFFEFMKGFPGY